MTAYCLSTRAPDTPSTTRAPRDTSTTSPTRPPNSFSTGSRLQTCSPDPRRSSWPLASIISDSGLLFLLVIGRDSEAFHSARAQAGDLVLKQTAALAFVALIAMGLASVPASAVVAPANADRPRSLSPKATVTEFVTASGKSVRTFRIGREPEGMVMAPGGKFVYVANAESDSISVIPATGTTTAARS